MKNEENKEDQDQNPEESKYLRGTAYRVNEGVQEGRTRN